MISLSWTRVVLLTPAAVALLALPLRAQDPTTHPSITQETFLRPPPEIAEAVMAPRHLNVTLENPSPDGRFFLVEQEAGPPTMASFARPFYRLGGEQIDWTANRARQLTTRSELGLRVIDRQSGNSVTIQLPRGHRVSSARWSPDGSQIAFFAHGDDATHVYAADPATGRARQISRTPVLATLYTSFEWTPDSRSVVTMLLPENRGAAPVEPAVPAGPQVRLTTPDENRIRTYPDLLENAHEKALLEYYTTGQLVTINVQNRQTRPIGAPAMISDASVSPDGRFVRVTTMRKPFSYIVPTRQFGNAEEIWSLEDGSVIATVNEQPLRDGSPRDSTNGDGATPERRNIAWRPDGQGLSFLQLAPRPSGDSTAQSDEGQGEERGRSRRRDRVFQWLPPFDSSSTHVVYENTTRLSNVRYSADAQTLILSEQQGDNGHDFAVLLSDPSTKHTIWRGERSGGGGGFFGGGRTPTLLTKTLTNGASVVRTSPDGNSVFLSGTEYHDNPMQEGPQSYIDRVEIRTGAKTRVYESENTDVFERVLEVLNDDATQLIVSREGPQDVPDSFFRDVTAGAFRQLTQNTDHTPDLTNAQRRRYEVTRVDGLKLAVEVTLPQSWRPGQRLPGMIWFYPREYTDQDNYDEEVRDRYNKNRFPNIGARSMDILVRQGYAVIEPDAPIIGESGRMNNNYVHDLRNNLSATIDFLDKEGIIDRERMGVGGHSYGAFSTMNAMVHTPFFKAGIAGDGNYNRTLTPFSFQSERRSLWEARDLYFGMSPLFYANNLSGALLMYHGAHDQNVGTFPINSWRLFESLEALGKTASLYVYPFEDHGPATEETLLDLWARWTAWLDTYVKHAGSEAARVTTDGQLQGRAGR